MFGFSIQKLVFTVVLIIVVIYGKRLISGIGGAAKNVGGGANARPVGEDTQQCPVCGVYVSAANPVACGRSDCPHKS
jgi:hypothetical protein